MFVDSLPPGWVVCPASGCGIVAQEVPCQNLGPDLCTLNASCEYKPVWCEGGVSPAQLAYQSEQSGSCPEGKTTDSSGTCGTTTQDACTFACTDKRPDRCTDIPDQQACSARTDCQWGPGPCALIACNEDDLDCPSCPDACHDSEQPSCSQLDQVSCSGRADCLWTPKACRCDDLQGCDCQPYCQPTPSCPEVSPPPRDFCSDGLLLPSYDDQGCIVDFGCVYSDQCPSVATVSCAAGTPATEIRNESSGCVIGFKCEVPTLDTTQKAPSSGCDDLARSYEDVLKQAKQCSTEHADNAATDSCTLSVPNRLACSCPTFVNAATRDGAVQQLLNIREQWRQGGCENQVVCAAVPCFAPASATCSADSGQTGATATAGACSDQR